MTCCCCCGCVSTSEVGVLENCGKFDRTLDPGCFCLMPCVESLRGLVSLKVSISTVRVETKTRDNAVVNIEARLHYKVISEHAEAAFYRFSNPSEQIASFASSIVRGEVPKYTLDELFLMSDDIKKVVSSELTEKLRGFGFSLESTLLTRIEPSASVKMAISQTQINAYRRTAAEHESELNKILAVKAAEADYEEKRLSGVGLAEERKAIMKGLKSSIESFVRTVPNMNAKDVMNLLLLNQYFDAMKGVGGGKANHLVLMPNSAGAGPNFMADIVAGQAAAMRMV
ncbi:SPFH domain / Band 7 family [Novymonas esmeraldas]|uniref:SPFH domain / Band 7 family n=1 Tax=Novymonas esmeraldas TaxID=1808958 RepID=A0AAW0EXQ6_9TRYP